MWHVVKSQANILSNKYHNILHWDWHHWNMNIAIRDSYPHQFPNYQQKCALNFHWVSSSIIHYFAELPVLFSFQAINFSKTIKWFCFIDPAGESDFIVFMTDYDTFAGIFTCQKLAFAHRQSATLLSRSKDLDKLYVDKVTI